MLTVDCGITAVEEVAEARAAGLEVIVTDHHRPGETLPGLPDRRHEAVRTIPSRALRNRGRLQAARGAGCGGPRPPRRPRCPGHGRRRGPAPGREPRARRGGHAPPRSDGQARPAGPHARERRRPGVVQERSPWLAPGINAAGRSRTSRRGPRAAAHRRRARGPSGSRASSRLNRDRQAVEDRILRDAIRQVEWPEPKRAPRLRHRRKGLASRRHRHRRLAARRALRRPSC